MKFFSALVDLRDSEQVYHFENMDLKRGVGVIGVLFDFSVGKSYFFDPAAISRFLRAFRLIRNSKTLSSLENPLLTQRKREKREIFREDEKNHGREQRSELVHG